jgi:ataxin-3
MGTVYWEKQGADRLCAVHCLNAALQGPVFSAGDLAVHAERLDREEASLGLTTGQSQNVDASGNFSIQVMNAALDDKGLTTVNMDRQDVSSQVSGDYSKMSGYICNSHARQHWFTVRRVGSVWYNLDSLKHAPKEISEFGLDVFFASTRQQGFTIFVIQAKSPSGDLRLRGGDLPDPIPGRWPRLNPAQYFLNPAQIKQLEAEGAEAEKRAASDAERVANGDDEGGTKSFLVAGVGGAQKKVETDWSKLGSGNSLGGAAAAPPAPIDDDPDMAAAIAMSIEGMKNTLEAPAEEPADGEPACTVQVKLPSGKRCVRKFAKAGQLRQVLVWLEHLSVHDASLGLNLLQTKYNLVYGYPRVKLECLNCEAKKGGENVTCKTLTESGFEPQEQLQLALA